MCELITSAYVGKFYTERMRTEYDYPDLPPPEPPEKPDWTTSGCLILFGLPFFLVGLFMSYSQVKSLLFHADAKNWIATPATIISAELQTHQGDDSTTYSVHGTYQYEVNGQAYTSDRIQYESGSDNVGNFHYEAFKKLEEHRKNEQPMTVYVNPENTEQAIAFRDLRKGMFIFKMLFVVVFGGVGLGLMLYSKTAKKTAQAEYELAQAHIEEPWKWREQWQSHALLCNSKSSVRMFGFMAIFWNILSWPAGFMILQELRNSGDKFLYLFLLFPIIGLFLIFTYFKKKHQYQKHGDATLTLDEMPAKIGDTLRATFRGMANAEEIEALDITLECVHKEVVKSGKNSRTRENTIWENTISKPSNASFSNGSLMFPFSMQIPEGLPASSWQDSKHTIEWCVKIKPSAKGGHSMEFEIPVLS